MPRDLFSPPDLHTPKRSKWTIAGSVLLHIGLVFALLIVPVLSAFDTFVVRANNSLQFTLPVMAMPVAPPPPSAEAPKITPDINPNAAPPSPPEKPVTREITAPPPPGVLIADGGTGSGLGPTGSPLGTGKDPIVGPPPPAPTTVGPVRPGGDIKWPTRTKFVEPHYPDVARKARIDGTVYLEATIDANGIVRDVKVLKSIPFLDDAAKAAVSQWQYTPTKLNGVAVPIILTVTVTFKLG